MLVEGDIEETSQIQEMTENFQKNLVKQLKLLMESRDAGQWLEHYKFLNNNHAIVGDTVNHIFKFMLITLSFFEDFITEKAKNYIEGIMIKKLDIGIKLKEYSCFLSSKIPLDTMGASRTLFN